MWTTHELIILTNFHKDWDKIVDFFLLANYWTCPIFYYSVFIVDYHGSDTFINVAHGKIL